MRFETESRIKARHTPLLALVLLCISSMPANAQQCAKEPQKAIAEAQAALAHPSEAGDHAALVCLVSVIQSLNEKVDSLSRGDTAFVARIKAPSGISLGSGKAGTK